MQTWPKFERPYSAIPSGKIIRTSMNESVYDGLSCLEVVFLCVISYFLHVSAVWHP